MKSYVTKYYEILLHVLLEFGGSKSYVIVIVACNLDSIRAWALSFGYFFAERSSHSLQLVVKNIESN